MTLLRSGVAVVETLDLRRAEQGWYELICLPLLMPGADGAPAPSPQPSSGSRPSQVPDEPTGENRANISSPGCWCATPSGPTGGCGRCSR